MDSFNGKMAIITGGSSGIGLALARCLVQEGARVHLLARRMEQLETAREELIRAAKQPQDGVGIHSVDVSDAAQVNAVVASIVEDGVPDILVNSVGITHPGTFEDQDAEIFRDLMEVNYFGTVNVIRAVLPGMIRRKTGYIVNISSVAGFLGTYGYSAYGATKYAVRGLSDVLRVELKQRGIRVSVVFPPDTQTPQLVWEEAYKPAVTKTLSANAKVMTSEAVAKEILRGIRKNRYLILPGFESKLFYFLDHLPGKLVYPIMDYMVRDAIKKNQDHP